MKWKELAKRGFYLYQRVWFYSGFAIAEARKPLQLWNEALLVITFLTIQGIRFTAKDMILSYLGIMILALLIGKALVKTGVMRYNTTLGNTQNRELLEILERVKKIENTLNKKE